MSTEEVLARAEDVLTDWHGSPDAATWRADGSHQQGERPLPPRAAPRELTPEQLEQLEVAMRRAVVQIAEHLAPALQRLAMGVVDVAESMGRSLAELGLALAPPTPEADPVDPRAHALAMRQARHTGPPPAPLDGRRRRR